jgi:hypothetical protein
MGKQTAKNPADVASKWSRNLSSSTASIQAGVQAVTVAPTQLAARQQDAYLQGIQNAVASGKWAAGLQRVSLGDWQNSMITKGIPRIQQGAIAGKPRVENFMGQLIPFIQTQQRALAATPRGSLEQNLNRMTTWARGMATFKRTS